MPSCVLMFKQELPLMFPDDPDVMDHERDVRPVRIPDAAPQACGSLNTEFRRPLARFLYHAAAPAGGNGSVRTREVLDCARHRDRADRTLFGR